MTDKDNPCLNCPDICCYLKGDYGLRLSKDEFEACFKDRKQNLNVRVEDKIVILSSKDGTVCPNLMEKGCRIYRIRPIDCRLYPYQMSPLYETRNRVKFILYLQPDRDCILDRAFYLPEDKARALVEEFGRKVYGNKKIIVETYKKAFLPRLSNKCEVLFVKFCKKLGLDP